MANNVLKYQRDDPALRETLQRKWNRPVAWPLLLALAALVLAIMPAVVVYRRRERSGALTPAQRAA
jgi:hypothetical protein